MRPDIANVFRGIRSVRWSVVAKAATIQISLVLRLANPKKRKKRAVSVLKVGASRITVNVFKEVKIVAKNVSV